MPGFNLKIQSPDTGVHCAWAACTVLLIAVLLLRRATYKWRHVPKEDESRHSGLLMEL